MWCSQSKYWLNLPGFTYCNFHKANTCFLYLLVLNFLSCIVFNSQTCWEALNCWWVLLMCFDHSLYVPFPPHILPVHPEEKGRGEAVSHKYWLCIRLRFGWIAVTTKMNFSDILVLPVQLRHNWLKFYFTQTGLLCGWEILHIRKFQLARCLRWVR